MAHIAQLTLTAGRRFGPGCLGPLHGRVPDAAHKAVTELRASFRSSADAVDPDVDADADGAVAKLPGGLLWGLRTCTACPGGPTLDAYHRISECAALEAARAASFVRALQYGADWGAQDPQRAEQTAAAVKALKEVESARDTLPGRTFTFLATLAAPVQGDLSAEGRTGMPMSWVCMLIPPQGTKRAKAQSLSMAVTFRGFMPLAVTVRKRVKPEV